MKITNFQDSELWQKAHALTLEVYNIGKRFPAEEGENIVLMQRNAAVSMTSGITEAYKISDNVLKLHHFNLAEASLAKLRYLLLLSNDLGFIDPTKLLLNIEDIEKLMRSEIGVIIALI